MEAWYAVRSKPRQELMAAEHLARQRYEVYLPLMRSQKRRGGRWSEVVEPLFPGYLFVRLDLEHRSALPIRSTRGAIGLVCFGGTPRPVPDSVVESLFATPTDHTGAIRRERLFAPGDPVEVTVGRLAGLRAVFLAPTGRERALLLLDLLGRHHRVVVPERVLVPAH